MTSDILVKVRPDGSGTVDHRMTVRPSAFGELDKLLLPEVKLGTDVTALANQLRDELARPLGGVPGVRHPVTTINEADAVGGVVSYAFPDIRMLPLDMMPHIPNGGWSFQTQDPGASTVLRLSLDQAEDGLERLTIRLPRFALDPAGEPLSAIASGPPNEMAALRSILRGARVTLAVETETPLLRTNSPFREQNRVTIFDARLEQALFSDEMQALAIVPGSFDELVLALADVPGIKLAREPEITLDFQNPSTVAPPPQPGPASNDTEVFVATLVAGDKGLVVGPPINISNSPGYDNQPSFSPDGEQIFFASARGATEPARDGGSTTIPRTDIYRYEIASRRLFRVTRTPESEFSPTVMPDGKRLSMVRVEADGTQHLCSIGLANAPARETSVMMPNMKPVGYHAWMDADRVALYVLGQDQQPATLQVASVRDGISRTFASNIGRSIQRMPSGSISFVQRESTGDAVSAVVSALDPASLTVKGLVKPAAGMTDPFIAWMPDGAALMAAGSTIYRWRPGDVDWTAVSHLDGFGLHDVTRLAVSARGDRLAIVAQK